VIPCRCASLNTLAGEGAEDYATQHLDSMREDARGRATLRCPETDVMFYLEPAEGNYTGEGPRRLRRKP
jgi:hypothetical protein